MMKLSGKRSSIGVVVSFSLLLLSAIILPEAAFGKDNDSAQRTNTANQGSSGRSEYFNRPLYRFLQTELIHVRQTFSRTYFYKKGWRYSVGIWGGPFDEIFKGSPKALALSYKAQQHITAGAILAFTGMPIAAIAWFALSFARPELILSMDANGKPDGIALGGFAILGGGILLSLIGLAVYAAAGIYLQEAVTVYNQEVIRKASRRKWSLNFGIHEHGLCGSFQVKF